MDIFSVNMSLQSGQRVRAGSHQWLRNYTGLCHFSFPWLGLRFKLTFPATWGPCGSCEVQMFSCRNVAHILLIWETHESGTGKVGSWIVTPHIPSSESWGGMLGAPCLFPLHSERVNRVKEKWVVSWNLEIISSGLLGICTGMMVSVEIYMCIYMHIYMYIVNFSIFCCINGERKMWLLT